ncbi:hypothetical protein HRK28_04235 [Rathayibacter sp. VKM Ac-2835]|uniref:hypothetical protein n=1 Tax=Rathayibacter sp. VKM Ac-2835 TaxID=2739043 RepID=UPI0015631FA1|nr:hypothetical protein [Rathayibacter sp. VKM Ac-2835]NRG40125.1 hypothetical protein [Rathayibacter sp. VKM Ac-2835]
MATGSKNLGKIYGEYAPVLDGRRIAQFLATQSWTIQSDRGYAEVWTAPGRAGSEIARVLLPIDKTLDDYSLRLEQAVDRIARSFSWDLTDLVEQIAAARADLFFIRVDQEMSDGTIPLRQATALLENIDDMIRSAALTANNPHASGRGRVPKAVNEFLNEDVRMGHTKQGSFIITVAARLDDAIDVAGQAVPSFTRQVMTTLARGLEVTKQVAENDPQAPNFDSAMDQGMRLPMVRALQAMGAGEGTRSLDLSFEWAPIEPMRSAVPKKIELSRDTIELLPDVASRLTIKESPQKVTLTGPVVELKRSDDGDPDGDSGEIVVRADVEGSWRRVSVALLGSDHDVAIVAYRQKLPFTVSGVLDKVGRSWRLTDQIEVDRSFIDFQQARLVDQALVPVVDGPKPRASEPHAITDGSA